MKAEAKTSEGPGLMLWGVKDVAAALAVSPATVWRWNSAGRLPRPLKIGGAVRWRADDVRGWVRAGCPDRGRWDAINAAGRN